MRSLVGILSLFLFLGDRSQGGRATYNKDIAPILWKNCAGRHRPGEIGPFSL